ncbi:MAG: hypothetical protein HOP33_08945 [Verrucomicrobia bacterium]|nr:hypothetical protein [Verrucomicrobiota bacterium]
MANAIKQHAGLPGNEAPWLGTWTSEGADRVDDTFYIESHTIFVSGLFAWMVYSPHYACGHTRYLRYEMIGTSTYVDASPARVTATWNGTVTWDRNTGLIKTALFVADNGTGGGIYWQADLNESTGEYTIVDNSADPSFTACTPFWRTANDTGFPDGKATITLREAGATFDYVLPDTGHGLGVDTQHMEINLTEPYTISDCVEDAQAMLADFTGRTWNKEYTRAYSGWPVTLTTAENDLCGGAAFAPYVSKIYGNLEQIGTALAGTNVPPMLPGRSLQMPALSENTGWSSYNYPGPGGDLLSDIIGAPYVFVSKFGASPHGESACLISIEQQLCDCVPSEASPMSWECSPGNYVLTGRTDCDTLFYDPATTPVEDTIYLGPGDQTYEYGFAMMFMRCLTGPCAYNVGPACCPS